MKLKYLYISAILALGASFTSCNDFLDVESPSQRPTANYYETPEQCEMALTGIYNGLMPLSEYIITLCEGRADDVWTEAADDKQRDYVDISVFNPNIYTISTLNNAWNDLYEIIARANLFLEKIEDVEFSDETVKDTFKAEARFLRAYAYFELVRYFGRVPMTLHTLTVDEAMNLRQSEPQDVYAEAIIPDLEYAIEKMDPDDKTFTSGGGNAPAGRANVTAAKALLGRVYLTMAGYPLYDSEKETLAQALFKEVIDHAEATGKYWAPSRDRWPHIWISDNDNQYHIFEIQYVAEKNYGNPAVFVSVPNVGTDYIGIQMSGNRITASSSLQNLFTSSGKKGDGVLDEGFSDIRYPYTVNQESSNRYFTKFFEHKIKRAKLGYTDIDGQIVDRTYFPINFPLIRLEDVMLMYAEIVGPGQGALYVNRIRERAGLEALSGEQLSADGFAQAVEDERRRELAFEGIRWHDIVRHGTYREKVAAKFEAYIYDEEGNTIHPDYIKYLSNIRPGTYIYPIPDTQMKARPGLYEQNEAYR